jgi:hypothetical protein
MKTTEIRDMPALAPPFPVGPEQLPRTGLVRRVSRVITIRTLAIFAIAFASANACLAAPTILKIRIPIIIPIPLWTGWKQIPDTGVGISTGNPFLTNVGCAVTYSKSDSQLYVAAQRANDNTIWVNSTTSLSNDPNSQPWQGWRMVDPSAKTVHTPGISFYSDPSGSFSFLDLVAVGIHGGSDQGVYINSQNLQTKNWSGWTLVPGGFATNTGVSIRNRVLYAKSSSTASNGAVYSNSADATGHWSGWHPFFLPVTTNTQPCPALDGGALQIYGSRTTDGQLFWLQFVPPTQYLVGMWTSIEAPYQALTDARAAGSLPDNSAPMYSAFVKGIGDHQVHGLTDSGLQTIPGNKLTDSGLDSCSVLISSAVAGDLTTQTDTFRNLLFLKDMGDHKIYFNSFLSSIKSSYNFF